VFASRMTGSLGSAGSLGAAVAAAHHAGGASGAAMLHAVGGAFVAGADRAVLAGVIVAAAGALIAFRAFRPVRSSAEVPAEIPAEMPAEVALAEVPVAAGTLRG
jgi:hypothetical protein